MTDSTTVSCGSGEDRSHENGSGQALVVLASGDPRPSPEGKAFEKQQAAVWRDLFDPGWREREAEHLKKFLDKVPLRQKGPL